ncbi:MAG: hypothetical protein AB7I41_14260 [Candidatus Sericytochromatia bacterium]
MSLVSGIPSPVPQALSVSAPPILKPLSSPDKTAVGLVSSNEPPVAKANPKAFQAPASEPDTLPTNAEIHHKIENAASEKIRENSSTMPIPKGLAQVMAIISGRGPTGGVALSSLSDKDLVHSLMRSEDVHGNRFIKVNRNAAEIERSGILTDFKALAARHIAVPESEYDRSLADDAVLVMTDFAKMTPQEIHTLKENAYKHPEAMRDLPLAIERKYYGCDQHKQYGAIVEALTGGVISAEEAMAMNPTGGIPGPGAKEVPLVGSFDAGLRHAMRHDATGFLITRFNVGPGYGSENSPVALGKTNPLSGQVLGLLREAIGSPSELPNFDYVAQTGRYQNSGLA